MNYKTRELVAGVVAGVARTKTRRRQIRDKIRFSNLISSVGEYDFPVVKFPETINISFCFDGNGWQYAAVSIYSLLNTSGTRCSYNIYLVVDDTVTAAIRRKLMRLVRNTGSKIIFLDANHDFDKSNTHGWSRAVYYRMMLPDLLPGVDKIIYADIDVIFLRDLVDLWRIDMDKNLLAGVRDRLDGYINSGVLVMNLKQIRKDKVYAKWISMSRKHDYPNPDQDILNITARERVMFLPPKYNFQSMLGSGVYKTNSDRQIEDLRHNLVIIHYSNWMKPWHAPDARPIFSQIWWRFERMAEKEHSLDLNFSAK